MEMMTANPEEGAPEKPRQVLKWLEGPISNFQKQQSARPQELLTCTKSQENGASGSRKTTLVTAERILPAKFENSEPSSFILTSDIEKSHALRKPWLKVGRFVLPKATWPEPQLSIGTKCNRMGQNECWEAIGPARTLFTEIAKSVGKLLDERMDELEVGEPVAVDILTFGMYMIGKTPNTAQATLLFTCQRQKPRRRAIKFIKESSILKGKPKIALAESSVVPNATNNNYLRLLAGDRGSKELREVGGSRLWNRVAAESLESSHLVWTPPIRIFAVPVICASTGRKATVGGILQVNGKYYGITVAHVFENFSSRPVSTEPESSSKRQDGDTEFAFDDIEYEVDDAEIAFDDSDVVITSQASVSSLATTLSRSATTTTRSSRLQDDNKSIMAITLGTDPGPDQVFLDEEEDFLSRGNFRAARKLGDLSISSAMQDLQLGRDWALIAFDENGLEEAQSGGLKAALLENIVLPKSVVAHLERDASIVALRGHGVISRGSISSSTTMMRLPHDNHFQELWTVRLDSPLIDGDSGAWILDAVTGDLYGQVVAGLSGGVAAYIVPAYKIFDDIRRVLGPTDLVSNSTEAVTEKIEEQRHHPSQWNCPAKPPTQKGRSAVESEDTHICSYNPEATNRQPLALGMTRPKYEENDSIDDDSGYDTPGSSSIGGNSTRVPRSLGLRIFEETHIYSGLITRHIAWNSLRSFSESQSNEESDGLSFINEPLVTQLVNTEEVLQHLREYPFDENGHRLLALLRIREQPLTAKSLKYKFGDKYDDFEMVDMYNTAECCQLSGNVAEHFLEALSVSSRSTTRDGASRSISGRLMSFRNPTPAMLGILHKTLINYFDMDGIFKLLAGDSRTMALSRPYASDSRQQRTLIFSFKYFTLVGDGCSPEPWQQSDSWKRNESRNTETNGHIPLSTCTSVLALSFSGIPIKTLRDRRSKRGRKRRIGATFSIWSPWQVLNIQCYPDRHSTFEYEPKDFVTGPETFLARLLAEFRDAQKRFEEVHAKIQSLIYPNNDALLFDGDLRDRLLFEDENFTYSRRYFWAFQTLGIMQDSIRAIMDAYNDTFTDKVWNVHYSTLWQAANEDEPQAKQWTKRMGYLRKQLNAEMDEFERENERIADTRKEIRQLRDQLFSGTSVLESRKSVELSEVTILQSNNIKLLTLVCIFFLPLTFVTSVFGMTNSPSGASFKWFGITMATVCVPFFLLIGSLNTTSGIGLWRAKCKYVASLLSAFGGMKRRRQRHPEVSPQSEDAQKSELMEMEIGTATTGVRSGIGLGHLIIYGVSLGFLAWFCVILSRRF